MTIKAGEIGKEFRYGTFFDLSTAGATFELTIKGPGVNVTVPNERITAPDTDSTDPIAGTFPANTYMQFLTVAEDFPVPGSYTICGTYNDATPKTFFGDEAEFTVGEACS